MEKSLTDFKAKTSDSGKIPLDCVWYDVEEMRILLRKKTKKAIYSMVYRGLLPACKLGGTLLFQRIEIDRLILANRVPGGPKSSEAKKKS